MVTRSVAQAMLFVAVISSASAAQELQGNGFLFGKPTASLTLRAGYAGANAGSDIFSFTTSQFTLRHRDFSSFGWGADLAFHLTEQIDLQVSGDFSGSNKRSEYRDYLDNNDLPIEQNTSFNRTRWTAGLRWNFRPSGRELGRLAWIPTRMVPYAGVGGGWMWYQFKQSGDFIDFQNGMRVSPDVLESSSWTGTWHMLGGLDWALNERFGVTSQARYEWAKADLGSDYVGFHRIDLSGVTTAVGLTVRF